MKIDIVFLSPGNGYITTKVLREILAALDDKLSSDDLDGMIEEIDSDDSGTVDFKGWFYKSCLVFVNNLSVKCNTLL